MRDLHRAVNVVNIFRMLSRRFFRELTDSILNGSAIRRPPFCVLAGVRPDCAKLRPGGSPTVRIAFSSSSTRWKARQGKDRFAKEAKVQGLKSRAAFKLLEVKKTRS
jgi:21S rRNA (uridine2791-2'-O)-methyltransferase